MDRQVGQFFIGKVFLVGVFHILGNALGTFVVLFAVFHDELAEHLVPLALGVLYELALEQPLGEIAQVHHETAEIQRFPVELLLVEVFHHGNGALDELCDLIHLAHVGVQLGVHDMQGDERRLVLVEGDAHLLPDDPQAVLAQMVLRGVVTHDGAFQGIAELRALGLAQDGKADVVGQGDEQGFIELLGDLRLDVLDQAFRQGQVFNGDLFHQFPELSLSGLFFHAVGAFHSFGIHCLSPVALKTDPPSGDDQLVARFVHHAQDVIIDDLFDPHFHAHPICVKK